jgi:hypothetical protein
MKKVLLFLLVLASFIGLNAQNGNYGQLDPFFGNGGMTSFAPTTSFDKSKALLVCPDDKIVAVSQARVDNSIYHISVARLNADGSLDDSFGQNGMVLLLPFTSGNPDNNVMDAVLLEDGKILIAGYLFDPYTYSSPFFVQLNPDGSYDTSFGDNGFRKYDQGHSAIVRATNVQADGKILLIGQDQGSGDKAMIIRCMPNGDLDTSFGDNGVKIMEIDNAFAFDSDAYKSYVLPDNKLLVIAGAAYDPMSGQRKSVMFILNENGSVDTSFGENGYRWLSPGEGPDFLMGVKVVNDKIYVSGHTWIAQSPTVPQLWYDYVLMRFDMNGNIDSSYGENGIVRARMKERGNYHEDFLVTSSGVVYGLSTLDGYSEDGVWRSSITIYSFDENGVLDPNFGTDGYAIIADEALELVGARIAFTADSSLLVSGNLALYNSYDSDILLARFTTKSFDNVEENIASESDLVMVFPNPATDVVSFNMKDAEAEYDLTVYNMLGCVVMRAKIRSGETIDVSDLSSGSYLIQMQSDSESVAGRFVKQ